MLKANVGQFEELMLWSPAVVVVVVVIVVDVVVVVVSLSSMKVGLE
jgi:hypothetical protein